ncbi:hypothetical protein VTJ49DRAFT_4355 [Mycothermus thermophilus]|uniref:non-specific serine/threonine protein kinase n=1 Tax=Humicola insolens TaxID=85995 RepID=A0ABR3VM87_HUMIN
MSRTTTVRKYGKKSRKPRAEALFAELPPTPVKSPQPRHLLVDLAGSDCDTASKRDSGVEFQEQPQACAGVDEISKLLDAVTLDQAPAQDSTIDDSSLRSPTSRRRRSEHGSSPRPFSKVLLDDLEELTWEELLADCAKIEKIGEASYAEVYRVTAPDGATSVLKAVRLEGHPIKAQMAAQVRSGLVDEEPHCADEVAGELQMAEWLADIPGFLVYKGRYLVRGKATKDLITAHQTFHRREKRRDPDRLQWYPSPTRYLDNTEFLVMEVADAGKPLEGFEVKTIDQVWDILLLTALALARGEDVLEFEHRDLHEGNICVKQARQTTPRPPGILRRLGFSGVEVTLLDYGLSRVACPDAPLPDSTTPRVIALDLEQDLSLFQSTHAPHATVYRQMRSFLMHGDPMAALDPAEHTTAYPEVLEPDTGGSGGKLTWTAYEPYTNVLWLAHLYETLTTAPVLTAMQRNMTTSICGLL